MGAGGDGDVPYAIRYTEAALAMLEKVADRRVRKSLLDRADALATEPDRKGKALVGEFAGYRSIRAVGQRYRIVYHVDEPSKVVHIVAASLRRRGNKRDVYELLTRVLGRPPAVTEIQAFVGLKRPREATRRRFLDATRDERRRLNAQQR